MTTVTITNKCKYNVKGVIISCQINNTWTAYFEDASDLRATGETKEEAIGNLIANHFLVVNKVA